MTEENQRAYVERELEKSGFPLEIEVSSFLEERSWFVASSTFYPDLDLGIPREIDLVASKTLSVDSFGKSLHPYELRLALIIQCKKSGKYHWVFYSRPRKEDEAEFDIGLAYTDFVDFARTRSLLPLMFPSLAIQHELQYGPLKAVLPPAVARSLTDTRQMGISHPKNFRFLIARTKSTSYEEVPHERRKMPEDLKIYEVAGSLLKATLHDVELSRKMMTMMFEYMSKRGEVPREAKWPINLFLPILLFDGGIWRWVKRAESTDEVLLQVNLSSPNYLPPYPLICVVNKDRLFRFVPEIEEDLLKIADLVSGNLASLNQQRTLIEETLTSAPT